MGQAHLKMGYPTSDRKLGQAHLKMGQDRKLGCNIYTNAMLRLPDFVIDALEQINNVHVRTKVSTIEATSRDQTLVKNSKRPPESP